MHALSTRCGEYLTALRKPPRRAPARLGVPAFESALASMLDFSTPPHLGPERALALAVLRRAVFDLRRYDHDQTGGRLPRQYKEAYEWVVSDDRTWPYSFLNLCDALSISASRVRRAVAPPPATMQYP